MQIDLSIDAAVITEISLIVNLTAHCECQRFHSADKFPIAARLPELDDANPASVTFGNDIVALGHGTLEIIKAFSVFPIEAPLARTGQIAVSFPLLFRTMIHMAPAVPPGICLSLV